MTVDEKLSAICELIQEDVNQRGLRADPADNLITRTAGDFQAACRSIAETRIPALGVVTGFYIPAADPPAGETDGPLGALFLARALRPLGIGVILATDPFCRRALEAGLDACGLSRSVLLRTLPTHDDPDLYAGYFDFWDLGGPSDSSAPSPTHYLALERVGPSHTAESLQAQAGVTREIVERFIEEVPAEKRGRCYSMRGRDITDLMRPAHLLFEEQLDEAICAEEDRLPTIGIGDGGNEIGMGKVPWEVIRRNIPDGGLVACRVPTDHLIVAGISNRGAYGLAAGVALLRGQRLDPALFDVERERELLRVMVEQGPLVDGVTGKQTVTVDGLDFEEYAKPLRRIGELVRD